MRSSLFSLALAALVIATVPGRAAQAPPAGQIVNVTGAVEVAAPGGSAHKGTLLFQLHTGDVIRVGGGGTAQVVLFQNGARFGLEPRASARVEAAALKPLGGPPPRALPGLSTAFVKRIHTAAAPPNTRILGVLVRDAGDSGSGPRHPAPNGAVRAGPIVLRWAGPVEAEQLRLQIRDGEHTVHRADLPASAREYPLAEGVLRPGEYYVWSVAAIRGGDTGPRCRALIRLLLPEERAELERLEKETAEARAAAPDDPGPLLLLAHEVYEPLGLYDEAVAAYQAVLRLKPDDEGVQAALKRLLADG